MLNTAPGAHGRLKLGALEHIFEIGHLHAVEVAHPGLRNLLDPLVPVPVHQVVDDAGVALGHVGVNVDCTCVVFHCRYHDYLFLIGRDRKALYVFFHARYTLAASAVGVHHPHLVHCLVGLVILVNKGNALAAVDPHSVALAVGGVGELCGILAVDVHHPQVAVALVGSDVDACHPVEHALAVG